MLELDHGGDRLAAHVLDRVLVAEPVRALDGVVHVPAPVVLAHVAERGADASLRRDGVAAGGEELGHAGGGEPLGGDAERRPQARPARADHDDVVLVLDDGVGRRHPIQLPRATLSTLNAAVAASAMASSFIAISAASFTPSA